MTAAATEPVDGAAMAAQSPFSTALRAAISHRGLSLDQLSAQLRAAGTPVSVSALSYWQTGENQPERTSSLAALRQLETLLAVPDGSLAGLVPPRRRRGPRRPTALPMAPRTLWNRPDSVSRALAKLGARPEDLELPTKVSTHARFDYDTNGHARLMRFHRVLRAHRDGVHRFLFVVRCTRLSQQPTVIQTDGCRLGRFRADVPSATCAYEFLLDRPLRQGELTVVDFALSFPPGESERKTDLLLHQATRDVAVHVNFDPARLPLRCFSYFQASRRAPLTRLRDFDAHDMADRLQIVALDPPPGIYGFRWEWPPPRTG